MRQTIPIGVPRTNGVRPLLLNPSRRHRQIGSAVVRPYISTHGCFCRSANQDRATPRALAGRDIAGFVPNHERTRQVDIELACGLMEQTRQWLTAGAALLGCMKAVV